MRQPESGAPDGEPTPLRAMAPYRVLVHTPPDEWGWGAEPVELRAATEANPTKSKSTPIWYTYTAEESKAVWLASKAYKALGINAK